MHSRQPVLILGASARAAAFSAWQAGLSSWCADLFADADLQRLCPVRQVPAATYPDGLLDAIPQAPPAPVLYTGALENRPDLIERIRRPLWGNSADVLRRVRDPLLLAETLRDEGLPCLPVRQEPPGNKGRWLLKPRKSAGGWGIQFATGQPCDPGRYYWQEFRAGLDVSALFLGNHEDRAELLGVTRQLVGDPWLHAATFQYAGSVGPLPLDPTLHEQLRGLGSTLTRRFALRGLFGVDGILDGDTFWPVEVNPRYTASVEILERAFQTSLLTLHRAVFENRPVSWQEPRAVIHGKAILFAHRTLTFPAVGPWSATLGQPPSADAEFADLPHAGETIEQGRPVLTLFASADSVAECVRALQEKARHLDWHLHGR